MRHLLRRNERRARSAGRDFALPSQAAPRLRAEMGAGVGGWRRTLSALLGANATVLTTDPYTPDGIATVQLRTLSSAAKVPGQHVIVLLCNPNL